MIDKKKLSEMLKHIEAVSKESDEPDLEEYWDDIVDVLSDNLEDTKAYLNSCNENEIWLIAGYFEDISGNFQSKEFIDFLHELKKKFPNLDLEKDIEWADSALI